ncbi:MAG: type II toxin-antitoxin system HicB family antitoxin [Methylococcaceae bacterium]
MHKQFTVIIHKEDDAYVSLCPELDIASQGINIEEVKDNLKEAVELFFSVLRKPKSNTFWQNHELFDAT